jgi:hypothetical protein
MVPSDRPSDVAGVSGRSDPLVGARHSGRRQGNQPRPPRRAVDLAARPRLFHAAVRIRRRDDSGRSSAARRLIRAALAGHESPEATRNYVEPGQDAPTAAVDHHAGGRE